MLDDDIVYIAIVMLSENGQKIRSVDTKVNFSSKFKLDGLEIIKKREVEVQL